MVAPSLLIWRERLMAVAAESLVESVAAEEEWLEEEDENEAEGSCWADFFFAMVRII
jgi:hypothetical protein